MAEERDLNIKCPTRGDCVHGRRCLIQARCTDPVVPQREVEKRVAELTAQVEALEAEK